MADVKDTKNASAHAQPSLPALADSWINSLDTGDLILFNRKCSAMSPLGAFLCVSTKFVHDTKWDHVAVVVRRRKPGSDSEAELLALEAGLSGVHLRPVADRLQHSKAHEVAIRKLLVKRTPHMRQEAEHFVTDMQNAAYDKSIRNLLNASVTTGLQKSHQVRAGAGRLLLSWIQRSILFA